MKRNFFTSFVMLFAFLGVCAQETINIGYCHGEVSKNESMPVKGKHWVSGAVYMPAEMLSRYKGDITAVKAGLASRINIDSLRVWVRKSLDGENLSEGLITTKTPQAIARGWNEVPLEASYKITGGEGLYVGFSYKQRSEASGLSILDQPQENAFFMHVDDGGDWLDLGITGTLSIEAVVSGVDLPKYDLAVTNATAKPNLSQGIIAINATVRNCATQAVSGFTLKVTLDDGEDVYEEHMATPLEPYASCQVDITIPYMANAGTANAISLEVSAIDDGDDVFTDNNTAAVAFSFARKVLIEEFTTEKCPNCPRVANYLHEVLGTSKYQDKLVPVCHHSGYNVDEYTKQCDKDLLFLYDSDGTFAPAMMFDRYVIPGKTSPLICPDKNDIITQSDIRLAKESTVLLGVHGDYDKETGKLSVLVRGMRTEENEATQGYLTVYITEDNIKAEHQAGAGDGDYYHQHVIRAYNSSFGDVLTWTDNAFERSYTFDISPDWDVSQMNVVAFVGGYRKGDKARCEVENADMQKIEALTSGITSVDGDAQVVSEQWYGINGCAVSPHSADKGIYIIKQTLSDGNTISHKVVRR